MTFRYLVLALTPSDQFGPGLAKRAAREQLKAADERWIDRFAWGVIAVTVAALAGQLIRWWLA